MDGRSRHCLELLCRAPSKRTREPALLFVHGAYVGAWCWDVFFLRYLAERGFPSYALSLRGHGASECNVDYATLGIDDYVDDVESVVEDIEGPLLLIGHSMGGLIVRRLLARSPRSSVRLRAGVLMAPVPSSGLTPAFWEIAMRSPLLLLEMNQMQFGRARFNELGHIRGALFSASVHDAVVHGYFQRMQREAQRALFEMSMLHLQVLQPVPKVPLLVLGAANDGFFAPQSIASTAAALGARWELVPDMAHAMMLEPGWRDVADRIAAWAQEA